MKLKYYKDVKALIQYQNKFLILKKENFIGGEYDLPGGRKNFEESDELALRREVKEETGLEIEIIKPLNTWTLDLPEKGIHLDGKTYLCKSFSGNVKISEEHTNYLWTPKEKLKNHNIPGWLKDAISHL